MNLPLSPRNTQGFGMLEALMSLGIAAIVIGSLASFMIQNAGLQQKTRALQELAERSEGLRLALSNQTFCKESFKKDGVPAKYDPISTLGLPGVYSDVNEIYMSEKLIAKLGETRNGLKVTALSLRPLEPLTTITNQNNTKTFPSQLKIEYQRSDHPSAQKYVKSYYINVSTNNSDKTINSCFASGGQLQRASAWRYGITLSGIGCSVKDIPDEDKKQYLGDATCADDDGNHLCDNDQYSAYPTPTTPDPLRTCYYDVKSIFTAHPAEGSWSNVHGTCAPRPPKPNSDMLENLYHYYWTIGFPVRQAGEHKRFRKPSPAYAWTYTIADSVFTKDEGRCPATPTLYPPEENPNDIFYFPDSGGNKDLLAIGCRADLGWFITGCTRANMGGGSSDAEIIYDGGNPICVTKNHMTPHGEGRAWINLVTHIYVLCSRMKQ